MSFPQLTQFVCQVPDCGKVTLAQRFADCRVWLDKDESGNLFSMDVCPEHKAKFLRLVSDFAEGK